MRQTAPRRSQRIGKRLTASPSNHEMTDQHVADDGTVALPGTGVVWIEGRQLSVKVIIGIGYGPYS
jgi:hypothetical protein